jgi:hypothetical protein
LVPFVEFGTPPRPTVTLYVPDGFAIVPVTTPPAPPPPPVFQPPAPPPATIKYSTVEEPVALFLYGADIPQNADDRIDADIVMIIQS